MSTVQMGGRAGSPRADASPSLGGMLWVHASRDERASETSSVSPSLTEMVSRLAQVLFGMAVLFLGIVLVFTLVLMPIGLPLALLGVALIAAPSDS